MFLSLKSATLREHALDFLRKLSLFHWGLPCADWLRVLMNRVNPDLFAACFRSFVAERLPDKIDQIAIDGKTSRRSHDRSKGRAALHLVSAYATTHNLVLGQIGVLEKSNEITAIPVLLHYLAQSGALEHVPKKLNDFFDQNMLQGYVFARILFDRTDSVRSESALTGALVSIDAMGCQSDIAAAIVDGGGDYFLATRLRTY